MNIQNKLEILAGAAQYDVSRASSGICHSFTPAELTDLTIDFHRRNFIEGLLLSSGVNHNPDDTMELLIRTARSLRNGYIHCR